MLQNDFSQLFIWIYAMVGSYYHLVLELSHMPGELPIFCIQHLVALDLINFEEYMWCEFYHGIYYHVIRAPN